jgi:NAD(P) transhydrogenase subunit alpha
VSNNLTIYLFIFMLATFLGLEVIKRVSPLLHTPLMSLTNAISAISLVGSIELTGTHYHDHLAVTLGTIAITASFANVVGGFVITDRMLKMFKKREPVKTPAGGASAGGGS